MTKLEQHDSQLNVTAAETPEQARVAQNIAARMVDAAEFKQLMISGRRMERANGAVPNMRGLRDTDTGELFVTDERTLFPPIREQRLV